MNRNTFKYILDYYDKEVVKMISENTGSMNLKH